MTLNKQTYYTLALSAYFSLFALLMAWNTLLMPSARFPTALVLIVTVTPLLLPLRGFLHGRSKSTAWRAYVSLLYITHGLVEAMANLAERWYATGEAILALTLFMSATFYVRSNGKEPNQ